MALVEITHHFLQDQTTCTLLVLQIKTQYIGWCFLPGKHANSLNICSNHVFSNAWSSKFKETFTYHVQPNFFMVIIITRSIVWKKIISKAALGLYFHAFLFPQTKRLFSESIHFFRWNLERRQTRSCGL